MARAEFAHPAMTWVSARWAIWSSQPDQRSPVRHRRKEHPRTEVAYRFSGSIETIYASLVVRLELHGLFPRARTNGNMRSSFSRAGNRLGFSMRQIEERHGRTGNLFSARYQRVSDRVTFIRFVTDHLRAKGNRHPGTGFGFTAQVRKEVHNREAIEAAHPGRETGRSPVNSAIRLSSIPKSVEENLPAGPVVGRKAAATDQDRRATHRGGGEAVPGRPTAIHGGGRPPDSHPAPVGPPLRKTTRSRAFAGPSWKPNLIQELKVRRLEYLIISGDVAGAQRRPKGIRRSLCDGGRVGEAVRAGCQPRRGLCRGITT